MVDQTKTAAPGTQRPDRRRARTRSALIGAGQRLFAVRSIDGVTIDDIVEAADVAKGSFYNHFEDKESLATTIVELVQKDCELEVSQANQGITDAGVRVARAAATLIRYARQHPDRYRSMINLTKRRARMTAPINSGLRHDIQSGILSGQFSAITLEGGMLAVFGLIATAVEHLATSKSQENPEEIAREIAFMLLRALGLPSKRAKSTADRAVQDLFLAPPSDQFD